MKKDRDTSWNNKIIYRVMKMRNLVYALLFMAFAIACTNDGDLGGTPTPPPRWWRGR